MMILSEIIQNNCEKKWGNCVFYLNIFKIFNCHENKLMKNIKKGKKSFFEYMKGSIYLSEI